MNEVLQVTVEQLLLQQKLRDDTIRFLQNENAKIARELNSSRIINQKLIDGINQLKWFSAISNN